MSIQLCIYLCTYYSVYCSNFLFIYTNKRKITSTIKIDLKIGMRSNTSIITKMVNVFDFLRKGRRWKLFLSKNTMGSRELYKEKISYINILTYIIKFYPDLRKTKSVQVHPFITRRTSDHNFRYNDNDVMFIMV